MNLIRLIAALVTSVLAGGLIHFFFSIWIINYIDVWQVTTYRAMIVWCLFFIALSNKLGKNVSLKRFVIFTCISSGVIATAYSGIFPPRVELTIAEMLRFFAANMLSGALSSLLFWWIYVKMPDSLIYSRSH